MRYSRAGTGAARPASFRELRGEGPLAALPEEIFLEAPLLLVERRPRRERDRRARAARRRHHGRRPPLDPQPGQELGEAVDDGDAEVGRHVLERLAMGEATAGGGEGPAHGDVAEPEACLQLVGEVLDLEVGPDADDSRAHRRDDEGPEHVLEPRPHEVGEDRGVDDGTARGHDRQQGVDEARARRAPQAVLAEVIEVGAGQGVVGVVPVADVDRGVAGSGSRLERLQEAGERPFLLPAPLGVAEEAAALRSPDVELVRKRRSRWEGGHEVVLQALGEEEVSHRRDQAGGGARKRERRETSSRSARSFSGSATMLRIEKTRRASVTDRVPTAESLRPANG